VRYIVAGLFETAKGYWTRGILARLLAGILGFASAFFSDTVTAVGVGILVLGAFASFSLSRSEHLKVAAEPLLALLDFEESLGWTISKQQRDEVSIDFGKFESLGRRVRGADPYFNPGTAPPGPGRLRSNILESALYTRTLAIDARNVIWAIFACLMIAFFAALISGVYRTLEHRTVTPQDHGAGDFVVAGLLLLVSLDLIPLAIRYSELANVAKRMRVLLGQMSATPSEPDVVAATVEYQIGRAVAPLLPTFTFLKRRFPLAAIWAKPDE
jgi:hypothetical protein